ncbi:hypothetical protein BST44_22765 [Mycobacterium scrofulaceum]|uniref:Uncharacterized protein n=1 Tax=Mycobacterium scrofulaceum TaxID=1783 RepID=A0A1X0K6R8_MYCSC|nr:hypothetical protein BST44_22765 [Mycobacterium scrofulaceum]
MELEAVDLTRDGTSVLLRLILGNGSTVELTLPNEQAEYTGAALFSYARGDEIKGGILRAAERG